MFKILTSSNEKKTTTLIPLLSPRLHFATTAVKGPINKKTNSQPNYLGKSIDQGDDFICGWERHSNVTYKDSKQLSALLEKHQDLEVWPGGTGRCLHILIPENRLGPPKKYFLQHSGAVKLRGGKSINQTTDVIDLQRQYAIVGGVLTDLTLNLRREKRF